MTEQFDAVLDNWALLSSGEGFHLSGNISDLQKRRFGTGTNVITSSIEGIHTLIKEGDIIHTRNSVYKLGAPNPYG